jgi:hypothetical protein
MIDQGLISYDQYQRVFDLLSDAVNKLGHPVRGRQASVPLPSIANVTAAINALNEYLNHFEIHPLRDDSQPDHVQGYHTNITKTIKFLAQTMGYTPSMYTSNDGDTIVLAFAYDKCPFLHNGRGLMLGHLEDLTMLSNWETDKIIPVAFKSNNNNMMLCGFEMKKETHEAYKVSVCVSLLPRCVSENVRSFTGLLFLVGQ